MKHALLNRIFLSTALFSFVAIGCDDDDEVPNLPKTITQTVIDDPNFSVLEAAVVRANLATALSQGSLTVFAPDNAAFQAAGINEAAIASLPVARLDSILKYHVLGTTVTAAQVPASDAVTTLLGTKLFASKNANGVFVNGIKVKTADVSASNGVIHVIENVLIPPTKTIAQTAIDNPNLSLLVAAVQRAGLVDLISNPGKFTVFAPTNAAFNAAGFDDASDFDALTPQQVADIVTAHVLPTNVFASDLTNGAVVTTAKAGTTLTVELTGGPKVKITGSANAASNITATNIVATNGVVHVIDRVLL